MIFRPHKLRKLIYGEHLRGTSELGFHIRLSEKASTYDDLKLRKLIYGEYSEDTSELVFHIRLSEKNIKKASFSDSSLVLRVPRSGGTPGSAWDSDDRDLGSKLYHPHAPTSQYIVRMA